MKDDEYMEAYNKGYDMCADVAREHDDARRFWRYMIGVGLYTLGVISGAWFVYFS